MREPVLTAPSGVANREKMTSIRTREWPRRLKKEGGDEPASLARKATIVIVVVVMVVAVAVAATSCHAHRGA